MSIRCKATRPNLAYKNFLLEFRRQVSTAAEEKIKRQIKHAEVLQTLQTPHRARISAILHRTDAKEITRFSSLRRRWQNPYRYTTPIRDIQLFGKIPVRNLARMKAACQDLADQTSQFSVKLGRRSISESKPRVGRMVGYNVISEDLQNMHRWLLERLRAILKLKESDEVPRTLQSHFIPQILLQGELNDAVVERFEDRLKRKNAIPTELTVVGLRFQVYNSRFREDQEQWQEFNYPLSPPPSLLRASLKNAGLLP